MDPWLIPLSELNAPKMLREERRNTGGEEVVRKGDHRFKEKKQKNTKKPRQFSLPTGQCQFRDNILALIAPCPTAADYGWVPPPCESKSRLLAALDPY